jgi:hypothetical protein
MQVTQTGGKITILDIIAYLVFWLFNMRLKLDIKSTKTIALKYIPSSFRLISNIPNGLILLLSLKLSI